MQFRAQANQVLILSYKSYDKKTKRPNVELIATVNTKNWLLTMKENKEKPGTFHVFSDAEKVEFENEIVELKEKHETDAAVKRIKTATDALRAIKPADYKLLQERHYGGRFEYYMDEALLPIFSLTEFIKLNYRESKYLNLTTVNIESAYADMNELIERRSAGDEYCRISKLEFAAEDAKTEENKAYRAAKRVISAYENR